MGKLIGSGRMRPVYWCCYSLAKVLARFFLSYRVIGREKLIEDGPALIACNHASFLDPPLVGIAFKHEIHFLARKTLFRGFFGWLYPRLNSVPVDQERADFTSLKTIIRILRDGGRVLIFPEGQRTWDGTLCEPQPGVGLVIAKARVPVIPVRLFGTDEALPRGSRWPRVVDVTLVVGDPIEFTEEELNVRSKDEYKAISERVMNAVAALEPPPARTTIPA